MQPVLNNPSVNTEQERMTGTECSPLYISRERYVLKPFRFSLSHKVRSVLYAIYASSASSQESSAGILSYLCYVQPNY